MTIMESRSRTGSRACAVLAIGLLVAALAPAPAAGQFGSEVIERSRAALQKQAEDPDSSRVGGTIPADWDFELGEGIVAKQVTFYVDGGTPLYGKIFYPRDFTPDGNRWPAVAVGHGINAVAIGIEKFAARFAEHGLVAMAIDYRHYGFSGSGSDALMLVGDDPSTDAEPVTRREVPLVVKRTHLNNVHQVEDFMAAVSYLQGEPGVDPNRVGIWGTSNGGTVVQGVVGVDGRVRAAVAQVAGGGIRARSRAPGVAENAFENALVRVRTGRGGERMQGFSFRSMTDIWNAGGDIRSFSALAQMRPTTALLFTPAENDELTNGPGTAVAAAEFLRGLGRTSEAVVLPYLGHFQPYAGTGFEVSSRIGAEWLLRHLGGTPSASR
jgi:uncharacterized protein